MAKKKMLIAAHHLTIGGVQKSLISALKALDYDEYDVTLYLRKNRTDLLPFIDERVKVIINKDNSHYYRKPYAVLLQAKEFLYKLLNNKQKVEKAKEELAQRIVEDSMRYEHRTYFESESYDIAVAYVQGYVAQFVAEYVKADKKIVFFHTSTDDHHAMHEEILPKFDTVAALHTEQRELIECWYPAVADRIKIVGNYSDADFIKEQSVAFNIEKSDKLCLCSCGRLANVKGFDMAVKAAELLNDNKIDFIWYFVGDGPEREKLEKMISEKGLEKKIVITGMQKNPYPYMAACDIYVQPSYEESWGLTIIEAQQLIKPVISTSTVGGLKLIDNGINGILCELNAESIAQAVENMYSDKDLQYTITENLRSQDRSSDFEVFQAQWKNILN